MNNGKVISALGAILLACLYSVSVKAESVRNWQLEGEQYQSSSMLDLTQINRSESFGYFRNEEFDNGRHLGFSSSNSKSIGLRIQLVGYSPIRTTTVTTTVTQNPEPATMVLLGTGLAALAGYARRIKRKHDN